MDVAAQPVQGRTIDAVAMATPASGRIRARLFDTDREDRELDREQLFEIRPTERQLLWIDVTGELDPADLDRLCERFSLDRRTRDVLEHSGDEPRVSLHRSYLHIRIAADPSGSEPADVAWLDLIAGNNVTISRHDRGIPFLSGVDERIERDTAMGLISAAAFFGTIVDAAITSYHHAVDDIEADVDRLDALSLRGDDRSDLLGNLVRSRRRIARLRRLLADHRAVFAALASPDVATFVNDPDTAAVLANLNSRFEGAITAVEDAREGLLGSFDVFMSRTAQRTNEVMKVLTLTTVLLLPGAMLAGLLGMNVDVPLDKDSPWSFWLVVAAIIVLAIVIVLAARARRWL
jgi:magnesium transporter